MNQLSLTPVHRDDPDSSREAAERVAPKVGSQLARVLREVGRGGEVGRSNRQVQIAVCGGFIPGHPAWNKIATRTRTLERMGLIELVRDADGDPDLREHRDGGRLLTWRAT